MRKRKSFFERITGGVNIKEDRYNPVDFNIEEVDYSEEEKRETWGEEADELQGGELSIDLYETSSEIILQAMIAGVKPGNLDISLSREMVTIEGHREGPHGIPERSYFHRELYWGSFSRTVMLPDEIEVEESEATEAHGLLVIRMPKLDKARSTKLKVRSRT